MCVFEALTFLLWTFLQYPLSQQIIFNIFIFRVLSLSSLTTNNSFFWGNSQAYADTM